MPKYLLLKHYRGGVIGVGLGHEEARGGGEVEGVGAAGVVGFEDRRDPGRLQCRLGELGVLAGAEGGDPDHAPSIPLDARRSRP